MDIQVLKYHPEVPGELSSAIMSKFSMAENMLDGSIREMNFFDSSFFKEPNKSLPTPAQVRA